VLANERIWTGFDRLLVDDPTVEADELEDGPDTAGYDLDEARDRLRLGRRRVQSGSDGRLIFRL
jgi:hypothetical protein